MALTDEQKAAAQYLASCFYRPDAKNNPSGAITKTARRVGRDRTTIHNWLKKDEFLAEIEAAYKPFEDAFIEGMKSGLKSGNPKIFEIYANAMHTEALDSYSRRQREKYELEREKQDHQHELDAKLQAERPPLTIRYEEVEDGDRPDLSELEEDEDPETQG